VFAKQGYAVAINYKSNSEAANKQAKTITADGGRCIAIQADVASEEEVIRMFSTVDKALCKLSVLVNNSGILKKNLV
jgi:NAD(P)-dependent dehydrogenase (short-subunit alcohol dehydrogenase family)